jgi:hypothetical protein
VIRVGETTSSTSALRNDVKVAIGSFMGGTNVSINGINRKGDEF